MKNQNIKNVVVDHISEIAIGSGMILAMGVGYLWGFLIGRYDE